MKNEQNNQLMQNNIFDTALIFEGGGMRASYTAGVVNTLLENELYFDFVAGISAGASHSVNYLSRDPIKHGGVLSILSKIQTLAANGI